jgi:hypothetical protein
MPNIKQIIFTSTELQGAAIADALAASGIDSAVLETFADDTDLDQGAIEAAISADETVEYKWAVVIYKGGDR